MRTTGNTLLVLLGLVAIVGAVGGGVGGLVLLGLVVIWWRRAGDRGHHGP